ncbi:MAG: RIP metalloprotease RseP [Gemmatimonadales bacterium]|nr:RIP metalloprotease RseP [Gemmatimonadales bacterium]
MGLTIISTLVVIGVLVFIHELGHFLAAKWAGIHVHRFSLGLGAPIRWLSFKRNETEYSVSWLPLGGYVKMATDMEETDAVLEGGAAQAEVPAERRFEAKPVWVRMVVILAGVAMNALFAWIVLSGLIYVRGRPTLPVTTIAGVDSTRLPTGARDLELLGRGDRVVAINGVAVSTWEAMQREWLGTGDTVRIDLAERSPVIISGSLDDRRTALSTMRPLLPPVVSDVVPQRPGAKAGLARGDTIVRFDGVAVGEWREMVSQIESKADQSVELLVGRSTGRTVIQVTPAAEEVRDSSGSRTVGRIGIFGPLSPELREQVGLGTAIVEGGEWTWFIATQIVNTVRGMFSGRVSTREVGGPIAIGMAAGESARRGAEDFLLFMAAISVNLAVLNLLPIPLLDGGQFLFLLAEAVTRRPITGRVREGLTMAGFIALVMLMVLAFSNDIRRLLGI